MTVECYQLWDRDGLVVIATTDAGERRTRTLDGWNGEDMQDLRIAAMFWRHADRAFGMGERLAGLTEQCLAVERLFPDLREKLPA